MHHDCAQVFEVQESLETQKTDFSRRACVSELAEGFKSTFFFCVLLSPWLRLRRKEEVFKRREELLKSKDSDLQESLIRFSKFLQARRLLPTRLRRSLPHRL